MHPLGAISQVYFRMFPNMLKQKMAQIFQATDQEAESMVSLIFTIIVIADTLTAFLILWYKFLNGSKASVTRCNFHCNLSHNVGRHDPCRHVAPQSQNVTCNNL